MIQERNIYTDETVEFEVLGDKIEAVYMILGWTYNIINLSETENLVTVMTCNEIFNLERPETLDKACFILVGIDESSLLQAVDNRSFDELEWRLWESCARLCGGSIKKISPMIQFILKEDGTLSVKQKNLVSRRYSKGRKFRNALCIFGWVWVLNLGVLFLMLPTLLENSLVGLTAGTMLIMLSVIKICQRVPLATFYAFKNLPFGKKLRNVMSGSFFFNIMVSASIVYYINISLSEFDPTAAGGMLRPFDVMQARSIVQGDMWVFFQFTGRYLAWLLPIVLYSMLVPPLLLGSVREFFFRTWRFFLRYVTVYLVFQGILFFITASVGMISFSLAETTVNRNSLWYIFASYFHFSLEAPLEEVNAIAAGEMGLFSKTGTLVGSLTGAASYWVLSDMAAEHIWEEKKTPFHKRLLDLFHDRSTLLLVVMSVLCVLSSIQVYGMISHDSADIFAVLTCMVFIWAWLATLWLFVMETKPFSYIFTFAIMYFVEAVVVDPSMNSSGLWEVTVLTAAVRIVGFAFVAAMIAFFFRFMESFKSNMGRTEEEREAILAFTRGNIFKIISWIGKAYRR